MIHCTFWPMIATGTLDLALLAVAAAALLKYLFFTTPGRSSNPDHRGTILSPARITTAPALVDYGRQEMSWESGCQRF